MLIKITDHAQWGALFKAPLMPSLVLTLLLISLSFISAQYSALILALSPPMVSSSAGSVLFYIVALPLVYAVLYIVGLSVTFVFGIIIAPFLPREIPIISTLNRSRLGRVFFAIFFCALLFVGGLGLIVIMSLMSLGEYTSKLPYRKEAEVKKQGIFI